ncbi:protein kinase [Planomonospora sp. ID91781]|uniref:serine/threonine-protein kinase n=1 Tax=Planomonospora sp. ID91781 TaxID=2738135 RepID=UPI001A2F8810|nr:serine/threonine-protein kinase [Planomonospora sp. ID91781]MBG0824381.1 protein kinase [Planomonospora sp. ID91781]
MSADRLIGKVPPGPEVANITGTAPTGQAGQDRLIGRRYRLLSPVGRGGMGMVWHAHDVLLDRDVAVKELILPYGLDHAGKQVAHRRMMREARSAARLSHPGIVTVHDVVEEDGRPWIVMELVRAWSLEQAVRESGPLPVAQAAEIGIRVLDALRHAHASGILHRDVKPGNVLLTSDRVILTDFGIAALEGDVTITQTGLLMGSPAYIPPERLSGQPITQAGDLWAFGATLYAAVEGRPPYEGPDAVAVLGAILTQDPVRPQRAGALAGVIEGLLRKNPADRMSAAQVSDLLEQVLRSHGSSTPDRGPNGQVPAAMPVPGNSMPLHLMPPLDPPSGPMPSRIIETPSGPVRVPYDPQQDAPGGGPGHDPLSGPSGPYSTGPAGGPGQPAPLNVTIAPFTSLDSMSGGTRRGYDALRSTSAELSRPPGTSPGDAFFDTSFDALSSFSGEVPVPGAPAGDRSARGRSETAVRERPGRPESADRRERAEGRRTSRRRASSEGGWMRDGRPTPRLLAVGGAGVLAVVAAGLFVLTSGDDSGPVRERTSSASVSAPADGGQSRRTGEVPEGFKRLSAGGVAGAVPENWTVKERDDGAVVFSGPKSGAQSIVVTQVPVADPVAALGKLDRSGLDEYIEVGVSPVSYDGWKAADWEYTYVLPDGIVPMHGRTRYVVVGADSAYQIAIVVKDIDWEKSAGMMDAFFATFDPGA